MRRAKTIPSEHKIKESGLKVIPLPAKKAATAKIGNSDALVNPLDFAKAHFIKIEKLDRYFYFLFSGQ